MQRALYRAAILFLLFLPMAGTAASQTETIHASPYSIEAYLQIRQAVGAGWLADGNSLVYRTNITGTHQIWKISADGGYPEQLTFFEDSINYAVPSPTDANLILFSKATGGDERSQLFFMDTAGSRIERIAGEEKTISEFGAWSRDGKMIAYSSNRRNSAAFDIYVMDVETRRSNLVMQRDAYLEAVAFSPSGRRLIVSDLESNFNNNLYLIDLDHPETEPLLLTKHSGWAVYRNVQWPVGPKSAKGFYLVSNLGQQFVKMAYFNLEKLALQYQDEGRWDTENLSFSRNGTRMAFSNNFEGYSRLIVGDVVKQTALPSPQLHEGVISGLRFSPKGDRLAIAYSSPDRAADIFIADTQTGKTKQLTFSSTGGIPTESFVKPALVRYPTSDGMQIPAFLYLPQKMPQPGKVPAIMFIHGGPESQERPEFSALFQYFLNRGYAIFAPNVRGSDGYGKEYLQLDNVEKRMNSVRDMADGVAYIRKSIPLIDPDRIALLGGSYGGFMVLAGLTEYPQIFAAGVSVVGIANFETFLEKTGPWRRTQREAEYGSLETDRELLRRISPIHKVDRIQAPLMIIHGANDPRVPVGEAEQVVAALRARNLPVEYLFYADEGHGLRKLKNRIDAYPRMADFLDRYLRATQ